jgi:DNA replication protein DnaC
VAKMKFYFRGLSYFISYEKGSIILTSNYNFEDWGEIFQDNVVAAAIIGFTTPKYSISTVPAID